MGKIEKEFLKRKSVIFLIIPELTHTANSFSPSPSSLQASRGTFILISPSPKTSLLGSGKGVPFGSPVYMNNPMKNPPSALPFPESCLQHSQPLVLPHLILSCSISIIPWYSNEMLKYWHTLVPE